MESQALQRLSLTQATIRIREGRLAAESYAQSLTEAADAGRGLNAFIHRSDDLLAQARALDAALAFGRSPGPLAGAALAVKDNIAVAGLPTTAGTPGLRGWVPKTDAPAWGRLREAGALLMGKANMQELALGITSNNRAFGAVGNPAQPDLIAGGSSGGTAAAIAAGMAPAGLGSDTAGSIRVPASLCGVAGFRPSMGRSSQAGVVPLSHSRDTVGPMGRTVADLMLLDRIVTGAAEAPALDLAGVRLGRPAQHFWDDLDPVTRTAAEAALEKLKRAGVELVEVDVAEIVDVAARIGRTLTLYECIPDLDAFLRREQAGVSAEAVIAQIASPVVAAAYAAAAAGTVIRDTYAEAKEVFQPRLRRLYVELFVHTGVAALVFPATPLPARPIGEDATVELNGRRVDTRSTFLRNTEHGALAGLPCVVVPAPSATLPVGLELDGAYMDDAALLALARAVEAALSYGGD